MILAQLLIMNFIIKTRCKEIQSPRLSATESPRLSALVPMELCVKWYGMHRECYKVTLYSVMSMERGLSVVGD